MSSVEWKSFAKILQTPPDNLCTTPFSTILILNNDEIIGIPSDDRHTPEIYSIWKYTIKQNKWIKSYDFPMEKCGYPTAALNHDKSTLYIFGDPGFILIMDLKNGKFMQTERKFHDGSHCRSLFINGQFHVFGGWDEEAKAHFVWNENLKNLIKIHDFNGMQHMTRLTSQQMIYLPSKQSALIIPSDGYHHFLYSLETNKCDELSVKSDDENLTERLISAAVITKGEKYIICAGGRFQNRGIYVIDTETWKIYDPKIKCELSYVSACISNNDYKAEMSVFGYIRYCWKLFELSGMDIDYPPRDVINMIKSFISYEIMYILDSTNKNLWSVHVDQILQRITQL